MTDLIHSPHSNISKQLASDVRAAVREQRTLGDVLEWGHSRTPSQDVEEIVTQDEYTHDVVVRWDAEHYLVYDTT